MYLIELNGERQCVKDLAGYEDWQVIAEGELVLPEDEAVFNGETWQIPIDILKARKWQEIKNEAAAVRNCGLSTKFGKFDVDQLSQNKLVNCLGVAAINPQTFVTSWTLFDNTTVELNYDALAEVCSSVIEFENTLNKALQAAREKIGLTVEQNQLGSIDLAFERGTNE